MNTQVMQILILMVQYLQNVAFSLEKGSNGQNHSLSDSHHPILLVRFPPPNKKNPSIIFHLPFPLTLFGKPWDIEFSCERPISSVPDKITGCPFASNKAWTTSVCLILPRIQKGKKKQHLLISIFNSLWILGIPISKKRFIQWKCNTISSMPKTSWFVMVDRIYILNCKSLFLFNAQLFIFIIISAEDCLWLSIIIKNMV